MRANLEFCILIIGIKINYLQYNLFINSKTTGCVICQLDETFMYGQFTHRTINNLNAEKKT